jgi:predicted RNase H-like nuclease
VLGIDAAWTSRNSSGVALISTGRARPRLIRASPSFEEFVKGAGPGDWKPRHDFRASLGDVLAKAEEIGDGSVAVVAVDMPLSASTIRGRRFCDSQISKAFGSRGCATHTPTIDRPGDVSTQFLRAATTAGFVLKTQRKSPPKTPALLEVYPHPALLFLLASDYRLPYKFAKRRTYWREYSKPQRLEKLTRVWNGILRGLESKIDMSLTLDCVDRPNWYWKKWEDLIDAVVCSWIGLEWLAAKAIPYGDKDAAIWVPEGSAHQ